jgi:long-chain fatty acid transport protein
MIMKHKKITLISVTFASLFPITVSATNGIFPMGNSIIAQGMGGAGIANAGGTISVADNPALATKVSNTWAVGDTLLNPSRSSNVGKGYVKSDKDFFLIPQGGAIKSLNDRISVGIINTAMGGMNTDFPADLLGTRAGQNLMGLIVAPTIAYKVNRKISIGASALLGYESLETKGPGQGGLPKNAKDSAFGFGIKVGITADVTPTTTLGLSAQTKIDMKEMDTHCDYMFAPVAAKDCSLDIPSVVGVGISSQLTDKVKFVGDIQRVDWDGVPIFGELFGWKDQTIYKLGMEYKVSDRLAVRGGYNHGASPIPINNTKNAVLAPAVVEDHLSVGFSKKLNKGIISAYYAHTLENEQKQNNATGLPAVKMNQNALGISYSANF